MHQFTSQGLTCHWCSYQTSNSSNSNPHDHFDLIPSPIPTPPTLPLSWVSSLDVLKSFNLGFHHFRLYNHIHDALQHDIQMVFHFALDKLAQNPYDVVVWHLFFLLPQWGLTLPPRGETTGHRETQI